MNEGSPGHRRKDEFLAVLAHGSQPIGCSGQRGLLREGVVGCSRRRRARDHGSAISRQALVDDLLDVSRINSGKIELRKELLDTRDLVEQAIAATRPAIDARHHTLQVELAMAPPSIEADGVRVVQIISNLLHNAARYTPPGGSIGLSAEAAGSELVLRITDTGQGIARELVDRVFDLFVQQSSGGEGLGVGLALVKRLVDLHGGSVSVKSDGLGCGAEFQVRLPGASRP
jgi:signal transduction histidine kinase